jgi:metal-responsive CopG/Arc/MetJ family transcriptional regulator
MSELERIHLTLPGDLKRQARAKAIAEGTNLSEVVRELLREYIDRGPVRVVIQRQEEDDLPPLKEMLRHGKSED